MRSRRVTRNGTTSVYRGEFAGGVLGGSKKIPQSLLRQVLHRYVPEDPVTRPKTGFGVPLDSWLRGPLRDWAEGLLSQTRLEEEGFFAPALIRHAWKEHLSGRRNHQHRLWTVLMFQAWSAGEHSLN